MIKGLPALIIEDQKEASDYLLEIVQQQSINIEIVGICTTVEDSIKSIDKLNPKLILMDIELPDGDAFDILDVFPNADFEVIFITGHGEFIEKALKYFAFSYLTKPYDVDELLRVVNQFLLRREKLYNEHKINVFKDFILEKGKKFLLHVGSEHISINLSSVIFCKADGNYTNFYMESGKTLLASHPLKYYDKLLSYKGFLRINRFHLINTAHVKSIYKKEAIILSKDIKIQISTRHKSLISNLIKDFNS